MPKFLFILFVLVGLNLTANAQKRVFHAGLLGGTSFSQVLNDNLSHYSKLGLYGGAYLLTELSEQWIAEVGMTYVMKGSKERQRQGEPYNGYKMTLGYVEFPVLIKFRMHEWDIEFGLSAGFLVHSKEENLWQSDAFSTAKFESFEFAGIIGVNYTLNEKWGLNLRSSNSILPIRYPADNVYHPPLYGQRNIILTFAVRYFIR
jgi:hypothetical protein